MKLLVGLLVTCLFLVGGLYLGAGDVKAQTTVDSTITLTGGEQSLTDSLEVVKKSLIDEDLKKAVEDAIVLIKDRPSKGDGVQAWLIWIGGVIGALGVIVGYFLKKFRTRKE